MNKKILEHFKKVDPILYSCAKKVEIYEGNDLPDLYSHLCDAIISQQLSEKAGTTILNRFKALFPNNIITPEKVQELTVEEIRQAGLSYSKVSYIKDLAQKIVDKEVELNKLHEMNEDDVIKELTKVKGIGPWTAEMFLMFALKRDDVFSCGDLGLKRAIQKMYGFTKEPTTEEMLKISQKWSPYRTYACRILWKSLQ
ncbi:MAG TPA: DNA-3-methyladenine glycosylase [Candidatus Nitrosocosmicus sp.]|nr:DNA-3-methyladenine glycosylase [Candidatus Nitrosocosmicus sp.]